jgi:seryl-tRNA synthetase
MDEGRAVEGRKANPFVCLATPLLTVSPKAFSAKDSVRVTEFLPGSAQNVECDITNSKQTIATFLPGSRIAHFASRDAACHTQISLANAFSNRELHLLEPTLTHRKQTIAPRPNRELSTNSCFRNSVLRGVCISHSLALLTLTQVGAQDWSLLTETGSHSETAVTHSKQTTASFLTGARIGTLAMRTSHAETHFVAPLLPRFANRRSRRSLRIHNRRFTAATAFRYSAWTMLDLGYVREHLDAIEKMARDRGITLDLAPFREIDTERRQLITSAERLKAERNRANEEIAGKKRAGEDATSILALMKEVSDRLKRDDARIAELDERLKQFLQTVPNIPHASVPVGKSAADNVEVRRWGAPPKFDFKPRPHWEIGEGAGILDFQAAVKIAGARFAVYKGLGARLERALANFFLDLHTGEHGYTEILPPFLVNTASLTGVGQLPKFAADMFHVEGTDLWLTPTSEVELTSLHRDETLDADKLPEKVCAWTACFRSEAGAAGKDTRGIKRQHQFQKVELFKFTRPEQSYDELELLVKNVEVVLQRLGLHYRIMLLCTADMGFASAKTYDIEVWLPSAGEFMEISSCSNTEAFQARRSGIRCKQKAGKSEFVHTLNGSGLAVGRTWIAIAENFQQADGSIVIPEVLKPYMGVDRIPPAGNT